MTEQPVEIRQHRGNEIDWIGDGVYALVKISRRGWVWSPALDYEAVASALQNGCHVEFIYKCDTF